MRSLAAASSAIAIVATLPLEGQAQGSDRLSEIVVTATRSERALGELTRSVSVVPQAEIARLQAPSVLNILRELPGISAASDGGLGGQVVIRGFSTQGFRAPLYIDGERFRGRNTLEYNLFNPHQIERIEVIRGPASSLYGTDAFGGVINIITKRARGDVDGPFRFTDNALWLDYGTVNHMHGGRVQIGGAGNGFDILFGGNFRRAYDYESPAGEIPNSTYRAPSMDAAIGYTFAPGHRIELVGRYADVYRERAGGQFGAPGASNQPPAPNRRQTDRSLVEEYLSLTYTAEALLGGALSNSKVSVYRRYLDTQVNVVPNARNPSTFVDVFVTGPTVWGGSLQSSADLSEAFSVTFGGDWYHEDRPGGLRSVRGGPIVQTSPQSEQLSYGAFLRAEWQVVPRFRLDGGIRIDQVETELDPTFIVDPVTRDLFTDAGTRENTPVTGTVGALWAVTDTVTVFGNVGTAFRAPSVTEITAVGSGVNPVFRAPNPDIEPEEAINYELGVRVAHANFEFEVAGFINDLTDLINRNAPITFNGEPAVQIQNIGEAEVRGVEIQGSWTPTPNWSLRANATWTEGEDETAGRPLAQIMPWNGVAAVRWEPQGQGYYIEASLDWALDNDTIDDRVERERDGYAVVNLYSAFELQQMAASLPDATLRLSVENLFDTEYRLPTTPENIAFPISPTNPLIQPGINLLVGLEFRF